MINYCKMQWDANKGLLLDCLTALYDKTKGDIEYKHLLRLVTVCILNHNHEDAGQPNSFDLDKITIIDNGDYQGTILFVIPEKTYQPSENEYLMTYIGYGSCSCCDALLDVLSRDEKDIPKLLLGICKDLVTNMIKPYNNGWRNKTLFNPV